MIATPHKHILFGSAHMWGHARAMAVLAGRMVRLRPVVVTFIAADNVYDRLKAEILSDISPDEQDALSCIRLIRTDQGTQLLDPSVYRDNFLDVWQKLCDGEPITYETPDDKAGSIKLCNEPPHAIVIDAFTVEIFNALYKHREVTAELTNLKIYTFLPSANDYVMTMFRDRDLVPVVEALAEREGISFDDAAYRVWAVPDGKVIYPPSLPPMHDYELSPQAFPTPRDICGRLFVRIHRMLLQADGVITLDAADYHPETVEVFRKFLGETSRKLYCSGPLISAGHNAPGYQAKGDAKGVMKFLDKQLSERGERSVVYISFGSMFWPLNPAKLVAALESLMQQDIPFVMANPSPMAKFPDESVKRLQEYQRAFVATWMPQQAILAHQATGWCLTHGGHNSVLECIDAGVPMIFWPIAADQPTNALYLSEIRNVAYELLEVRNGTGLGMIHRTGYTPSGTLDAVRDELRDVLARAFGMDGEMKRSRLQELRKTLAQAWSETGVARKETEEFLDDACAGAPVDIVAAK
ncbi:Glycosyltransferase Family 1 protein [Trametes cinnabarina]|uniref:Glycosyltransferase Family 1 protein n=1 Tax=Pycnoporus cinnabarinus TaxID=5643 RepID=A0A060SBH0_PYCCI|nr:Glycosyltransferase Family 1 protein [Trametes cinnabarina]